MFTLYTLMLQVPLALAQDTSNTETDSTDDATYETSGTRLRTMRLLRPPGMNPSTHQRQPNPRRQMQPLKP